MKINWEIFFGNSSVEEAIMQFDLGELTFKEFELACWPKKCKQAVRQLKARGYSKAKRAVRRALTLRGWYM